MNFPALKNFTYLDTARSGLLYDELLSWRKSHDLKFLQQGSLFSLNHESLLDELKVEIGRFFNANNHSVYLTQNFSLGFKSLLSLVDVNNTFLLVKNDYPSIINEVQMAGFKHFFVENSFDLEKQILNGIEKHKPNVLVLSIVQYINGTLLDLEFIKKIKILFPNLLIIADGTQYCGTIEFNFNNSKIDVLISSGYKWLLGGYGNGFVLIRDNIPQDFFINHKSVFINQILEPGHHDTFNFGSLLFSLNKLSEYGLNNIEKSIKEISVYAKQKFIDKGLLDNQTVKRVSHSNIFKLKGDKLLYNKLIENKILCSQRGDGIRVSLNFYNKKKEIDYLLSFF
tara:strand:- start:695 stop:1714 length:1020 start_codon:yes stop_codon:yes gene_type:complete